MKGKLKHFIHQVMRLNPFYRIQNNRIEALAQQVEHLKVITPNGDAITGLLKAIGTTAKSGTDIANAIKKNVLKQTDTGFGGNTEITPNTEPRILFFHVPKSAGTSVNEQFLHHYHPLSLYPQKVLMDFDYENIVSESAIRYGLKQQCFTNEEYLTQFPPYWYRFVNIHCTYHLVEKYTEAFDFVTLLRSPAERLYSEFNYLKVLYAHRRRDKTADALFLDKKFGYNYFEDISIHEFIETNPITAHSYHDNLLARLLSDNVLNTSQKLKNSQYCESHYIDSALKNLEKFKFVGFVEDLATFDHFIQQQYGFTDFCVKNHKAHQSKNLTKEFHLKPEKKEAWQLNGFSSKADCINYIMQSDACAIDNQIYAEAVRRYSKNPQLLASVDSLAPRKVAEPMPG
ncbi:MAG: hypothetical protein P1U40_13115 [Coxiellaceae bacterium]|nr:hypothetical protein [Coxiellaceae bacterium]